jgi:hypothetical protein
MPIGVELSGLQMAALEAHLRLPGGEQLAFLLAEWDRDTARVIDSLFIPGTGFDAQSPWHLTLTDAQRGEVIKWAHDRDGALIEAHAHGGGGRARFSCTDLEGFEESVPHIMWRLPGRPYAALVVAGSTFDGLAWQAKRQPPVQVDQLVVAGGPRKNATGATLAGGPTDER